METGPYTTSGISISAGRCRSIEVANNEYNIIASSTNIKKITGPFVAGSLQNGIDSGNRAANTTYHVYEITDGNNTDTLFSTSATSPSLPVGYVAARRVWSVITDSTGWIRDYEQKEDRCTWKLWPTADVNGTTAPTSRTLVTVSVPLGIVTGYLTQMWAQNVTAGLAYLLTSANGDYDKCTVLVPYSNGYGIADTPPMKTNTSSQIGHYANGASTTVYLYALGYIDNRGK
jgi:hypothetical protein